MATITDPLSHTTTFAYDSAGNLTSVTDLQSTQILSYMARMKEPILVFGGGDLDIFESVEHAVRYLERA